MSRFVRRISRISELRGLKGVVGVSRSPRGSPLPAARGGAAAGGLQGLRGAAVTPHTERATDAGSVVVRKPDINFAPSLRDLSVRPGRMSAATFIPAPAPQILAKRRGKSDHGAEFAEVPLCVRIVAAQRPWGEGSGASGSASALASARHSGRRAFRAPRPGDFSLRERSGRDSPDSERSHKLTRVGEHGPPRTTSASAVRNGYPSESVRTKSSALKQALSLLLPLR